LLVVPPALTAVGTALRRLLVATEALRLPSRLRMTVCPSD
jgi:hypothetical protein